jgi:hypothetical protein
MSHFGGYPGGDPRKFFPDPEMSSPEEMENHRKACEAWDRGDRTEPQVMLNGIGPDGTPFHASIRPFGIGVTEEDQDVEEPLPEPDLSLGELEDEELYGIYLSNSGQDSDEAMRILAERHGAALSYDPDEPEDEELA